MFSLERPYSGAIASMVNLLHLHHVLIKCSGDRVVDTSVLVLEGNVIVVEEVQRRLCIPHLIVGAVALL